MEKRDLIKEIEKEKEGIDRCLESMRESGIADFNNLIVIKSKVNYILNLVKNH
jgi:hypothetical protein